MPNFLKLANLPNLVFIFISQVANNNPTYVSVFQCSNGVQFRPTLWARSVQYSRVYVPGIAVSCYCGEPQEKRAVRRVFLTVSIRLRKELQIKAVGFLKWNDLNGDTRLLKDIWEVAIKAPKKFNELIMTFNGLTCMLTKLLSLIK